MKQPTLDQIDLVMRDLEAGIAFYRALGMEIPESAIWRTPSGVHHVDVTSPSGLQIHFDGDVGVDIDSEKMTIGYAPNWVPGSGVAFMFRVDGRDDVDALHDHMVSLGHKSHTAPFDAFWGARYAILVDPGGNLVSLASPMDKDKGGPPPEV